MEYGEIIKAFAEKLGGGAEVAPDADGTVMLDVDGMSLTIMYIEEVGQVALIGVVAEPPPEERMERLYKALLVANHNFTGTLGATLSINPESGNVSLCKAIPLALADADGFFSEVERFVNTLESWRDIVENFRGEEVKADDASGSAPADDAPLPFGGNGFMQV